MAKKGFKDSIKVQKPYKAFTPEEIIQFYRSEKNGSKDAKLLDVIDGYIKYVEQSGGLFLEFLETYGECIKIAQDNGIIGNVRVKARIKDFSSSNNNTKRKTLDDVFGIEVITDNEYDKEILILFNLLIFTILDSKKYNKGNGYLAYHCTGDLNVGSFNISMIRELINKSEVKEYRKQIDRPSKVANNIIKLFSNISNLKLAKLYSTFNEMNDKMRKYGKVEEKTDYFPVIEYHFITAQVARDSITGTANHSLYKKVDTGTIKDKYIGHDLLRGINYPLKFEMFSGSILKLQDQEKTLLEIWPFLQEIISKRPEERLARRQETIEINTLLATQFPFLQKYLGTSNEQLTDSKKAMRLKELKRKFMNNQIINGGTER